MTQAISHSTMGYPPLLDYGQYAIAEVQTQGARGTIKHICNGHPDVPGPAASVAPANLPSQPAHP